MIFALVLLISYGFINVHGHQIKFFESCPNVSGMDSLDLEKLLGKWYIIEIFNGISKCMTMNFDKKDESEIKITQEREFVILKELTIDHKNTRIARIKNPQTPSNMVISWAANIANIDFKVVDTDYDNYAVIFECQYFVMASRLSFAILSRERLPEDSIIQKAWTVINATNVDTSYMTVVEQSSCVANDEDSFTSVIDNGLFSILQSIKNGSIVKIEGEPEPEHEPEHEPEP